MKWINLLLIVILFAGCAHPPFTVVPEKNRGNERPLVYDSSEIPTIFSFQDETMEMKVALHSREFPNGILWSLSLETPIDTILPLKMFAYQDGNNYELIRLQSDQNYPNLAYYVLPPNFIKNCRFSDELTLNVKIDDKEWAKVSDETYVENFGMFYSFVTIDIKRNTSILFIH
jgi:hypothetical protein